MSEIKKIALGKNMQKFWMRCSMKNYEQGTNAISKRHPTLFKDMKDHYYAFRLSEDLVQTFLFEFVANLKGGPYTRLLSKWICNNRSKHNQSQRNLIQSLQFMRISRPSNNLPGFLPLTVEPDQRRRSIYKVFMEKSIYFVSNRQIYEIIGDEPWMDSEINCLCNVASDIKLWLTLGSKRSTWIQGK
jgi:hypothetical protein